MLAGLPTTFRHRAHLPLHQEHHGLDHAVTVHARTSGPLELADCRRLHPAATRTRSRRRPPPSMGTTTRPGHSHARTRAEGVSTTSCRDRHASQSTEIDEGRTRTSQRDPKTAQKALSGGQEGRLTLRSRFNRKLRRSTLTASAGTATLLLPCSSLVWGEASQ